MISNQRESQLKAELSHSLVNKFQMLCDFREVQNLYKVLNNDEHIIQAVNGMIPGHNNDTGLVILTQQRVIFFDHSLFFSSDSPSIPLYKINSATPQRGMLYGSIDFDDGGPSTFTATRVLAWKCQKFANAVQSEINIYNKKHNNDEISESSSTNDLSSLKELSNMLRNHIITPDEFRKERNKIIND